MNKPKWSERDLLFATAFMLRNLTNYLTMRDIIEPDKLRGLVEITAAQLDKEGAPRAAEALGYLMGAAQSGKIDEAVAKLRDKKA